MPSLFFFFNDTATTEIYTLSLHDALPISVNPCTEGSRRLLQCGGGEPRQGAVRRQGAMRELPRAAALHRAGQQPARARRDRRRRVPGGPVAYAHVPDCAAGGALGTSEGWGLSRQSPLDP